MRSRVKASGWHHTMGKSLKTSVDIVEKKKICDTAGN
jgi:hypothetical protein